MDTGLRRAALVAVVLLLCAGVGWAQPTGQVKQLTIDDPSPATFNSTTPFRTNKDIQRIKFTHDGNSGNYFITSTGADIDGSTFLPQPSDKSGDLLVGFSTEAMNPKTINLTLLQTRINVVVQTNVPVVIAYDITPPNLNMQSIRVGAMGGMGGQVLGLTAPGGTPSPGSTDPRIFTVAGVTNPFRTRADVFEIAASANDTFTPLAELQATGSIPEAGIGETAATQVPNQPGAFLIPFSLANQPDGTYTLTVKANDQVNDPIATATKVKGNVTVPHVVKIIRDTTRPKITNIQIIRPLNPTNGNDICGKPATTLSTGATTYVGTEPVGIKITFSEPISVPRVTVTQKTGTEQPLTPLATGGGRTDSFTFQFSPFAVAAQNGGVLLSISGRDAGTNGPADPGEGNDEAGNGVTPTQAAAIKLDRAFEVDTVGPDLRPGLDPRQQTSPFQGQVVNGDQIINGQFFPGTFPRHLTAELADPPTAGANPEQGSGVDFSQIVSQGAAATATSTRLGIVLVGPNGPIPVPPQVPIITGNPPSHIDVDIGPIDPLLANNPNFTRRVDNGLLVPKEGTYTMTINMIDAVCNTNTKKITFTVDTTPIKSNELSVKLDNTTIQAKGFCIPAQTSGQPPLQFPLVTVSSTAADFSSTASNFDVFASFNGIDSREYSTVTSAVAAPAGSKSVQKRVLGIEKVDPTGVDFPTPKQPVPGTGVEPGTVDPRLGKFDGPYSIRIRPVDAAGNRGVLTTDGRIVDHIDFDVNLDTQMPYTEAVFPPDHSFFSGRFNFVDATLFDPPAIRTPRTDVGADYGNPTNVTSVHAVPGCGIDVNKSQLAVRLEKPYRPNKVPPGFIVGNASTGKLKGTLRFQHLPINTDPNAPGFNVNDTRVKALLEFTKGTNSVIDSLPQDGTMDGTYTITSVPVDRAGLTMVTTSTQVGDTKPQRNGQYFGVNSTEITTVSIIGFGLLYDNIAPLLHVDQFPDANGHSFTEVSSGVTRGLALPQRTAASAAPQAGTSQHAQSTTNLQAGPVFLGKSFRITGFAQDLSAQGKEFNTGLNTVGGSGMARVEYDLKVVDTLFNTVTPADLGCTPPSPTVSPPTNSLQVGCTNPIISTKNAVLESFTNSIDPIPTSTDPIEVKPVSSVNPNLLNTDFSTTARPRHHWVIQDTLPDDKLIPKLRASPSVGPDRYLFSIRAIDRAGNKTEIQREVQLGTITSPALISPLDGGCTPNPATLKWAPVSGVTTYVVEVTAPNGALTTRRVDSGATQTLFTAAAGDGKYSWDVRSQDAFGNLSDVGQRNTFIVDTARPTVVQVSVTGNVAPVSRTGKVGQGDFFVDMIFSEPLARPPGVTFKPAGDSVPTQPLTTVSAQTLSDVHYQYRGSVPLTAKSTGWDGLATIKIAGPQGNSAKDVCGNPLFQQPTQTFEIDTGPDFDSRFFFNPVAPQEIVLTLVTSEELKTPPRMTELVNLHQIGNQSYPFKNNGLAYYTAFTLDQPDVASDVQLTVSLEDLDGNTARRPLEFTVTPLSSTASAQALSVDRKLSVKVPAGAISGKLPLYLLPPSNPTGQTVAASVHRMFPTAGTARSAAVVAALDARAPADQGLKIVKYLNEIGPGGVVLQKAAQINANPTGVFLPTGTSPGQLGLYVWNGSKWMWTGASTDGHSVVGQTRWFGPLALAIDRTGPELKGLSVGDGERLDTSTPQITGQISDAGAGVAREGIQVLIDDQPVDFSYRDDTGDLAFTPPRALSAGAHSLSVSVKDRAGNPAQQAKLSVLAPAPFGLSELIAYPNPARLFSRIRMRLTQPGTTAHVQVDIYDVSGRRVRRLEQDGPFSAATDLEWDLRNDRGHGCANGVYPYRTTITSTTGQTVKGTGKLAIQR